jgi:small nuclear ribonucleoprotein (snRNP)-like protein
MKQCKNCDKEIPESSTFCSRECAKEFKEKKENFAVYRLEQNLLKNSVNKEVELSLSHGANVRGIVRALDEQYAKIAVETEVNGQTEITIVKLGYVVSFKIKGYKR